MSTVRKHYAATEAFAGAGLATPVLYDSKLERLLRRAQRTAQSKGDCYIFSVERCPHSAWALFDALADGAATFVGTLPEVLTYNAGVEEVR